MKQTTSKPRQNKYHRTNKYEQTRDIVKKIKEKKVLERFKKAKLKKNYSKLCAKEGIVSDRVHIGPKQNNDAGNNHKQATKRNGRKSPFEREKQVYEKNIVEKKRQEEDRQRIISEIESRKAEKEKVRRDMLRKTNRGQPVLGVRISHLLKKLTKS